MSLHIQEILTLIIEHSKGYLLFFSFLFVKEVEDLSDGCGAKIAVIVVSEQFEGKPLLQRHRYRFFNLEILDVLKEKL